MATLLERQKEKVAEYTSDEIDAVAIKALTRLFENWKIGNQDASELAGVSLRTWNRMKTGSWAGSLNRDQRYRASALVGLYKALHVYFGDDLADQWAILPNSGPLFDGRAPVEFMVAGALPAIMETRNYVDALRGGL